MMTEGRRLATLRAYAVLDTGAEAEFDALAMRVATTFDVPCAMISFLDEQRQWHKARVGVDSPTIPRAFSLCTHSILHDGVTVIADARVDPRFAHHALVAGPGGIRFYAAAPIRAERNAAIGTVCIYDYAPRPMLSGQGQLQLAGFAAETMDLLVRRRARARRRAA